MTESWIRFFVLFQKNMLLDDAFKQYFKLKFFGNVNKYIEYYHFECVALDSCIQYLGLSPYETRTSNEITLVVAARCIPDLNSKKHRKWIKKLSDYSYKRVVFEGHDKIGVVSIAWDKV